MESGAEQEQQRMDCLGSGNEIDDRVTGLDEDDCGSANNRRRRHHGRNGSSSQATWGASSSKGPRWPVAANKAEHSAVAVLQENFNMVQLWRPSANLSMETVNKLPHKVKRYYQDILGWGEALPGYASAALQMGSVEYCRLLQEYRECQSQSKLWQAAYVKAFCNNLRTFLRDYNRWMLQHWPAAIEEIFLYPCNDATFQHLADTLRYMNDFSLPIREALYIFKQIRNTW